MDDYMVSHGKFAELLAGRKVIHSYFLRWPNSLGELVPHLVDDFIDPAW